MVGEEERRLRTRMVREEDRRLRTWTVGWVEDMLYQNRVVGATIQQQLIRRC